MSARDIIGRYPVATAGVAVILVLLAAVRLATVGQTGAATQPGDRWHIDLTTGELFPGAADAPAMPSPAGNPAALAMVYACGSCGNASESQVAYYERYTDEGLDLLAQVHQSRATPELLEKVEAQRMISPPTEAGQSPQWIAATSPQARALMDVQSRCGAGKVDICLP